jgi:hypothetical protein
MPLLAWPARSRSAGAAGWPLLLARARGPGPAGQCRRAWRACLRAHRAQAGMVPATVTAGMPSNQ